MKARDIKQTGTVINLDKERHLLYDLNAFCELEEKYGDINKAFAEIGKGSLKSIRSILWAGLVHEEEDLTEKEVGKLVNRFDSIELIAEKITEAILDAMPEVKEGKNK